MLKWLNEEIKRKTFEIMDLESHFTEDSYKDLGIEALE